LPNKGTNIVFELDGLNEVEVGAELDSGHATQAYGRRRGRGPHILNLCTKRNGQNTSCKFTSVIIGEATRIISRRSHSDVNNMKGNFSQIQEALKENESKLSKLESKMEENQQLLKELSAKISLYQRSLKNDKKSKQNETQSHYKS
jgi:hypothetical protein